MSKHKILKDFQYTSPDKKIVILKSGSFLIDYKYSNKSDDFIVDSDLVDSNPDFFQVIDWKMEFTSFLKSNKIPQPAVLSKKIIPFLEEIIPTIGQNDSSEDLSQREIEIETREKRLEIREDDFNLRLSRLELREKSYKDDIKSMEIREDRHKQDVIKYNESFSDLMEREIKLNEKERNLNKEILVSSQEIDQRQHEMNEKIKKDIDILSQRESDLSKKEKDLNKRESDIQTRESEIQSSLRKLESDREEFKDYAEEINNIDSEIKAWEALNFKMRRLRVKPNLAL